MSRRFLCNHKFHIRNASKHITGKPCDTISIGSTGDSANVQGHTFGTYSFTDTDERGNRVYRASIGGKYRYLHKTDVGEWMVSCIVL